MRRYRLQHVGVVPIVLFPGTTVIQCVAPGSTAVVVPVGAAMVIPTDAFVGQKMGSGLIWTGMGWLWFPRG